MKDLNANERDVLRRIKDKPDLQPLFFSKAIGLKWFNDLQREGYFDPKNFPDVVASEEEGYFRIPRWDAIEYLVKTAPELADCADKTYIERFLAVICDVTEYAKVSQLSNYQVWFRFAEILYHIPVEYISPSHLEIADYWLNDEFDRGLVADIFATKWIPLLLAKQNEHSSAIALQLIEILLKVKFSEDDTLGGSRKKATLRFDSYHADKSLSAFSNLSGRTLGIAAVEIFHDKFVELLEALGNDTYSCYWQPAIEEHEQNKYHDDVENILLKAFRDSLDGCVESLEEQAFDYLKTLIDSPLQTVRRVAVVMATKYYRYLFGLTESLLEDNFFQANYRHEIWCFLHAHYTSFPEEAKKKVLNIIEDKGVLDEDGRQLDSASAYQRATWLAAVRHAGTIEERLYSTSIEVAGAEPEHPEFSTFMSSGEFIEPRTPFSVEELSGKKPEDLVDLLNCFPAAGSWSEPGRPGLARTFKEVIKKSPLKYLEALDIFLQLDLRYIQAVLEAYSELWISKSKLPWADVWQKLLLYTGGLIASDLFWSEEDDQDQSVFSANRTWIVSSIARLFEAGVKEDGHAVPPSCHSSIFHQIQVLLQNQVGELFQADSDAVGIAINSARGRCIEALVNLALRECRLEDGSNGGEHISTWERYLPVFQEELDLTEKGQYEFSALLPYYLPNFLYMSREFVLDNLSNLFSNSNEVKWSCAIQGYCYVTKFFKDVYIFLIKNGDLKKSIDKEYLSDFVKKRVIENISVAYINDLEDISRGDSLISQVIDRNNIDELSSLIVFFRSLRQHDDQRISEKALELWAHILRKIDLETPAGQKIASKLCSWSIFLDQLDDASVELLRPIAPYADISHNGSELLSSLARLSDTQSFEANDIWLTMIPKIKYDYPDRSIRRIFKNLISNGRPGIRAARKTVDEYLKKGMDRPRHWLNETMMSDDAGEDST